MLRQEAQSHPGRYSNEGKRKQQKHRKGKKNEPAKEGGRTLAQDRRV